MNRKLKEKLSDQRIICRSQWFAAMVMIPMLLASDQVFNLMNWWWMIVLYYLTACCWISGEQVFQTLRDEI